MGWSPMVASYVTVWCSFLLYWGSLIITKVDKAASYWCIISRLGELFKITPKQKFTVLKRHHWMTLNLVTPPVQNIPSATGLTRCHVVSGRQLNSMKYYDLFHLSFNSEHFSKTQLPKHTDTQHLISVTSSSNVRCHRSQLIQKKNQIRAGHKHTGLFWKQF